MTCRHGSPVDKCRICLLEKQVESLQVKFDLQVEGHKFTASLYSDSLYETNRLNALVESQKEEIEKQAEITDQQSIANQYWHSDAKRLDGLNVMKQGLIDYQIKQIESLKAITELAVKALRDVMEYDIEIGCYTSTAINAIKEIERLQNGTLS